MLSSLLFTRFIQQKNKYFKIDQQKTRHLCTTVNVYTNPLPFYATQIIIFFLLQASQTILIKDWDFSQSGNTYTP